MDFKETGKFLGGGALIGVAACLILLATPYFRRSNQVGSLRKRGSSPATRTVPAALPVRAPAPIRAVKF